jgi:Predicted pPIWI-associating nuclease
MGSVSRQPNRKRQRVDKIVKAMKDFDLTNSPAWSDLDQLSAHTLLDGLEVDPDGVIIKGESFKGPISVYVLLQYGINTQDEFETSDSFMGEFEGHFDQDKEPVIDSVTIDTSPFYGEEKP